MLDISRRAFLGLGGGLVVAFSFSGRAWSEPVTRQVLAPEAFLKIGTSGAVELLLPEMEDGQGLYTMAAMLVAEELEIAPETIKIKPSPVQAPYEIGRVDIATQGAFLTTKRYWLPVRKAAARVRSMLVQAAAQGWNVDPASCTLERGYVKGPLDTQRVDFGALVPEASRLPVPQEVTLKAANDFQLIGHSQPRVDSAEKVSGRAVFSIDVRPAGVKFAALVTPPFVKGNLKSFSDTRARKVPGVTDIFRAGDLVCVVGNNFWAVQQGCAAVDGVWEQSAEQGACDTEDFLKILADGLQAKGIEAFRSLSPQQQKKVGAVKTSVTQRYQQGFLAHMPMEPLNFTVHVHQDECDIWVGTNAPLALRERAARALGLREEGVHIHNCYMGDNTGSYLNFAFVEDALKFARKVTYPLQFIQTREQNIAQDCYRPAYLDEVTASIDAQGNIVSYRQKVAGPAVTAHYLPQSMLSNGMDPGLLLASPAHMPYSFADVSLHYMRCDMPGLTPGWWRGNGGTRGLVALECMVDELAVQTGIGPVEYRRRFLGSNTRALAVLDLVADKADWDSPLPPRVGRGIAIHSLFGSCLAAVLEVEMPDTGELLLRRAIVAADCGQAVNPQQVCAQLEGGLLFGLSSALYGEITFTGARVQQRNFNHYRVLRMNEAPQVEVHLVPSKDEPGGAHDAGVAVAAPVLLNAIYSASGQRIRALPVHRYRSL